jgi:hypothetical protein
MRLPASARRSTVAARGPSGSTVNARRAASSSTPSSSRPVSSPQMASRGTVVVSSTGGEVVLRNRACSVAKNTATSRFSVQHTPMKGRSSTSACTVPRYAVPLFGQRLECLPRARRVKHTLPACVQFAQGHHWKHNVGTHHVAARDCVGKRLRLIALRHTAPQAAQGWYAGLATHEA